MKAQLGKMQAVRALKFGIAIEKVWKCLSDILRREHNFLSAQIVVNYFKAKE